MPSLLIAPHGVNLEVLTSVLVEVGLEPVHSERLAPGASLAALDISSFEAAVAILPEGGEGLTAVLVEIGIALGRGLPILIIVPPEAREPTALAPIRSVRSDLGNRDALSLHISLFARSLKASHDLGAQPHSHPPSAKQRVRAEALGHFKMQLRASREAETDRGLRFERWVMDLLRASGALVEPASEDRGSVDAVAVIPGEEDRLGVLLIEAKSWARPGLLEAAERTLQSYVMERGGGLGLLVYDSPERVVDVPTVPLVLAIQAEDLLERLKEEPLADLVVRARNEAIHRL